MNNKKRSSLTSHLIAAATATALSALATQGALAQKKYDTGATDTEIKIGNVEAYSGPASAYGIIGKTEDAYFRMINDGGGINGRKISWLSYHDRPRPPCRNIRTPRRCRSCSSPPAPASGTIRKSFPGPWAFSQATASRRGF